MSEDTLRKWLAQETDPVTALMAGDLSVSGDYQVAQKLAILQPLVRAATAGAGKTSASADAFRKHRAEVLRNAAQRAEEAELGVKVPILVRLGAISRQLDEQEMNFLHVKRRLEGEYGEAVFKEHEGGVRAFLKMYHQGIEKANASKLTTFKKQMEGIFQASGGQAIDFDSLRDRLSVEFGEKCAVSPFLDCLVNESYLGLHLAHVTLHLPFPLFPFFSSSFG